MAHISHLSYFGVFSTFQKKYHIENIISMPFKQFDFKKEF